MLQRTVVKLLVRNAPRFECRFLNDSWSERVAVGSDHMRHHKTRTAPLRQGAVRAGVGAPCAVDHLTASKPTVNVVPLNRGKPTVAEPAPRQASASEAQALLEAADDAFDSWMPCTWPDGMRAFLKNSNVPSTDDAAEAYQAWRRSKVEDERNALLRRIDDAKLVSTAPPIRGGGAVFGEPVTVRDYVRLYWPVVSWQIPGSYRAFRHNSAELVEPSTDILKYVSSIP